jgi:hypothetical protein
VHLFLCLLGVVISCHCVGWVVNSFSRGKGFCELCAIGQQSNEQAQVFKLIFHKLVHTA